MLFSCRVVDWKHDRLLYHNYGLVTWLIHSAIYTQEHSCWTSSSIMSQFPSLSQSQLMTLTGLDTSWRASTTRPSSLTATLRWGGGSNNNRSIVASGPFFTNRYSYYSFTFLCIISCSSYFNHSYLHITSEYTLANVLPRKIERWLFLTTSVFYD